MLKTIGCKGKVLALPSYGASVEAVGWPHWSLLEAVAWTTVPSVICA